MIISLPFPISAFKATWEVLIGSQQFVERFPRVQKLFKLFTTRNWVFKVGNLPQLTKSPPAYLNPPDPHQSTSTHHNHLSPPEPPQPTRTPAAHLNPPEPQQPTSIYQTHISPPQPNRITTTHQNHSILPQVKEETYRSKGGVAFKKYSFLDFPSNNHPYSCMSRVCKGRSQL